LNAYLLPDFAALSSPAIAAAALLSGPQTGYELTRTGQAGVSAISARR
jgi:hypothetical protein